MTAMMIVTAAMITPIVIVPTGPADHAINGANRTADTRTNRTTHDAADRPCGTIAAMYTFFSAADDALRMPGQRRREQHQKRQGRGPRKSSIGRLNGEGHCFHFRSLMFERGQMNDAISTP
jgi:hypothetical protein